MPNATWKKNELRLARVLGGQRVPVTGRAGQPDIRHEWLSIEVKQRASIPKWLTGALAQACKAARDGQLPVAIVHQARAHDSIVLVSLADFAEWFIGDGQAVADRDL